MNTLPLEELQTAFAEEVEESTRYLLYAQRAQQEGHPEIAALFVEAAQQDIQEYQRLYAFMLGELGTTEQNLQQAIMTEVADCTQLYPALARHAAVAGDDALAAHLCRVAATKERQAAVFRQAHERLHGQAARRVPAMEPPRQRAEQHPAAGTMPAWPARPAAWARRLHPAAAAVPQRRVAAGMEPTNGEGEFIDDLNEAQYEG
jgi:rubrerythrin